MDFEIPSELQKYLAELDAFIEAEIKPLEESDDNIRFFDHRREDCPHGLGAGRICRTRSGKQLLRSKAQAAALTTLGTTVTRFPKEFGGQAMVPTWIWPSSASTWRVKGLGLHNDLQNEHSIVGNNVGLLLMIRYGTEEQKAEWIDDGLADRDAKGSRLVSPSRITAPMPPIWRRAQCAFKEGRFDGWVINGREDLEHRHPQGARTTW